MKNLPAEQKTRVLFLGGEDPLEEGMATHSSVLARRIPWTEEPAGCLGLQRGGLRDPLPQARGTLRRTVEKTTLSSM